jgi:uncharacterized small protein (DUF1192 family)
LASGQTLKLREKSMEEPASIRLGRGQRLAEAMAEDLDLYSIGELDERIGALRAEIERCEAARRRKSDGRAAAEALFSRAASLADD